MSSIHVQLLLCLVFQQHHGWLSQHETIQVAQNGRPPIKVIDLGAAVDLRTGVNFNPETGTQRLHTSLLNAAELFIHPMTCLFHMPA